MGVKPGIKTSFAVGKLREDAKEVWDRYGAELKTLKQLAGTLRLDERDFSIVGEATGLSDSYLRAWRMLHELLGQGSKEFDHIAEALRDAAEEYERSEEARRELARQLRAAMDPDDNSVQPGPRPDDTMQPTR